MTDAAVKDQSLNRRIGRKRTTSGRWRGEFEAGRCLYAHLRLDIGRFEYIPTHYLGDLDLVVLVPFFAAETLGDAVANVLTPPFQRFFILPPHDRQPLTILGLEGLDID